MPLVNLMAWLGVGSIVKERLVFCLDVLTWFRLKRTLLFLCYEYNEISCDYQSYMVAFIVNRVRYCCWMMNISTCTCSWWNKKKLIISTCVPRSRLKLAIWMRLRHVCFIPSYMMIRIRKSLLPWCSLMALEIWLSVVSRLDGATTLAPTVLLMF
jgi:hypothetical protein